MNIITEVRKIKMGSLFIPHFGERLRVLLNQRLTGIYRLTNVLLRTENDFFS